MLATGYRPGEGGGWARAPHGFRIGGEGGLVSSVEDLALWDRNFTTRLVLDFLGMLEKGNRVEAAHTLQVFKADYCARRLPLGFYREFNSVSAYAVRAGESVFHLDGESDVDRDSIEIAHNLRSVVIPLARSIA